MLSSEHTYRPIRAHAVFQIEGTSARRVYISYFNILDRDRNPPAISLKVQIGAEEIFTPFSLGFLTTTGPASVFIREKDKS